MGDYRCSAETLQPTYISQFLLILACVSRQIPFVTSLPISKTEVTQRRNAFGLTLAIFSSGESEDERAVEALPSRASASSFARRVVFLGQCLITLLPLLHRQPWSDTSVVDDYLAITAKIYRRNH